jgi:hypothetical protein
MTRRYRLHPANMQNTPFAAYSRPGHLLPVGGVPARISELLHKSRDKQRRDWLSGCPPFVFVFVFFPLLVEERHFSLILLINCTRLYVPSANCGVQFM